MFGLQLPVVYMSVEIMAKRGSDGPRAQTIRKNEKCTPTSVICYKLGISRTSMPRAGKESVTGPLPPTGGSCNFQPTVIASQQFRYTVPVHILISGPLRTSPSQASLMG